MDVQTLAQPTHHHLQSAAVGSVAREDLPGYGPAVTVDHHTQHVLRQIRPPVPGVSSFTQIGFHVRVHVEAGGVDEDEIQLEAEQIAVTPGEFSFQLVSDLRQERSSAVEVLESQLVKARALDA